MSQPLPDWLAPPREERQQQPAAQAPVSIGSPAGAPPPAPPPGWKGAAPMAPPAQPVQPAILATFDTVKAQAFAEWFVWARRQFADVPRAQAAARAAFTAAVAGADAGQAGAAGMAAAAGEAPPPAPLDSRVEAYATWYAWALLQMRATETLSTDIAAAASLEQARGARPEAVAQVAQQMLSDARASAREQRGRLWRDPSLRGFIYGVLVTAWPLFSAVTTGHITTWRITAPAFGFMYTMRGIRRSQRPMLGIAGLCLNGFGAAITLAVIFFSQQ